MSSRSIARRRAKRGTGLSLWLAGLTIHAAFVVLNLATNGLRTVSPGASFTL